MTNYEILEIDENASEEDVKKAYKYMCKQYHPDIFSGDPAYAEKKMKQINEAYSAIMSEIHSKNNVRDDAKYSNEDFEDEQEYSDYGTDVDNEDEYYEDDDDEIESPWPDYQRQISLMLNIFEWWYLNGTRKFYYRYDTNLTKANEMLNANSVKTEKGEKDSNQQPNYQQNVEENKQEQTKHENEVKGFTKTYCKADFPQKEWLADKALQSNENICTWEKSRVLAFWDEIIVLVKERNNLQNKKNELEQKYISGKDQVKEKNNVSVNVRPIHILIGLVAWFIEWVVIGLIGGGMEKMFFLVLLLGWLPPLIIMGIVCKIERKQIINDSFPEIDLVESQLPHIKKEINDCNKRIEEIDQNDKMSLAVEVLGKSISAEYVEKIKECISDGVVSDIKDAINFVNCNLL